MVEKSKNWHSFSGILGSVVKFYPNFYEDTSDKDYDPENDAKDLMNSIYSLLQDYLQNYQVCDEGTRAVLRCLDATFSWISYMLEILKKRKKEIPGEEEEASVVETVNEGIKKILNLLAPDEKALDWRIERKIFMMKTTRLCGLSKNSDPLALLSCFQEEIDKAIDVLTWKNSSETHRFAKWTLEKLRTQILKDTNYISANNLTASDLLSKKLEEPIRNRFLRAIRSGRFEKESFGIDSTLILGEDGGLFMLLNNRNYLVDSLLSSGNLMSKNYLDSISILEKNNNVNEPKTRLILGQGGFGKVRLALSLFSSERASPGDIICLKKSKNLSPGKDTSSELEDLRVGENVFETTQNTLNDYFATDIAEIVKAPSIIDVAFIKDEFVMRKHWKAYLMMEVLPHNTGGNTFESEKYQKWEYQKPFLIDVFEGTKKLLSMNIAQTDLKMNNTLFDPITKTATIIDLGGIVRRNSSDEIKNFKLGNGCETTPCFFPPELVPPEENPEGVVATETEKGVDLNLSLVYICGVILRKTTTKDLDFQNIKWKTDLGLEDKEKIAKIFARTTSNDPEKRGNLETLIEEIKEIGDNKYKENALAKAYVSRVAEIISKDRPSLSLNEDIFQTKDVLIKIDATKDDPHILENQDTQDLLEAIDLFFEKDKQQVFLVLGSAGSGKSVAIQVKFIQAVLEWESGKPIPVYFNLAYETSLEKNFEITNRQLKTKLDFHGADLHLYLDSFDEGFEMEKKRDTLIKDYLADLSKNSKIIITCRAEYLSSERDLSWFQTDSSGLSHVYIAPFNYGQNKNIEQLAKNWLDKKGSSLRKKISISQTQKILELVQSSDFKTLIATCYIFEIVMTTLPIVLSEEHSEIGLSKSLFYNMYAGIYIEKEILLINCEQQLKLKKLLENCLKDFKLEGLPNETSIEFENMCLYFSKKLPSRANRTGFVEEDKEDLANSLRCLLEALGVFLAIELYVTQKFRINCSESQVLRKLGYKKQKPFKDQVVYQLLKLLPMKIEMKKHENKNNGECFYEVQTGFSHDIIKNVFLFKAIDYELQQFKTSSILSALSISKNLELTNLFASSLDRSNESTLKMLVIESKENKSGEAATRAANAISLLVAMGVKLIGERFENINIPGANLCGGCFKGTDFSGANLSGARCVNANFDECNMTDANLGGINFGLYPTITLNHVPLRLILPQNSDTLVSVPENPFEFVLWDINSGSKINEMNLEQKNKTLICSAFSADGTLFTTFIENIAPRCSVWTDSNNVRWTAETMDREIDLWDIKSFKHVRKIRLHDDLTQPLFNNNNMKENTLIRFGAENTIKILAYDNFECKWNIFDPENVADLAVHRYSFLAEDSFVSSCRKKIANYRNELEILNFNVFTDNYNEIDEQGSTHYLSIFDTESGHVTDIMISGKPSDCFFSADGNLLAYSLDDESHSAFLLNINTSETRRTIKNLKGQTKKITNIVFSPNGMRVLGCSEDFCLRMWDTVTANLLYTFAGQDHDVCSLSFSADCSKFAAGFRNKLIKIWNSYSVEGFQKVESHSDEITSIAISPEGRIFATASLDKTVRLWDSKTGIQISKIPSQGELFHGLTFSPEGTVLAAVYADINVYFWSTKTTEVLKYFQPHSSKIRASRFSEDGLRFATGADDMLVNIWDVKSLKLLLVLKGHTCSVTAVEFGNNLIFTGDINGTIMGWGKTGKLISENNINLFSVSFLQYLSWDNTYIIYAGSQTEIYAILDINVSFGCKAKKLDFKLNSHSGSVCLEKSLLEQGYIVQGTASSVQIYDSVSLRLLQTIRKGFFNLSKIAICRDGKLIIIGSNDGSLSIWNEGSHIRRDIGIPHKKEEFLELVSGHLLEKITIFTQSNEDYRDTQSVSEAIESFGQANIKRQSLRGLEEENKDKSETKGQPAIEPFTLVFSTEKYEIGLSAKDLVMNGAKISKANALVCWEAGALEGEVNFL